MLAALKKYTQHTKPDTSTFVVNGSAHEKHFSSAWISRQTFSFALFSPPCCSAFLFDNDFITFPCLHYPYYRLRHFTRVLVSCPSYSALVLANIGNIGCWSSWQLLMTASAVPAAAAIAVAAHFSPELGIEHLANGWTFPRTVLNISRELCAAPKRLSKVKLFTS